ncbi:MAG: phosphatase PAP2 family protein [Bacteroidetes bacterium]|nr:phosphatase PAP2 family protein [Bacteroidota bacterium]
MAGGNYFKISLLCMALPAIAVWLTTEPAAATVWANSHRTPPLDLLLTWFTRLAEWPVIVLALVLTLRNSWVAGIWAGLWYGIEGIIVNLLKHKIGALRPWSVVGDQLQQVAGEEILRFHSFPSGHTTAAFLGFGFLAVLTPNRWLQIACALAAGAVGYSRMYLGHHYLRDVLAGMALAALLLYMYQYTLPFFKNRMRRWVS